MNATADGGVVDGVDVGGGGGGAGFLMFPRGFRVLTAQIVSSSQRTFVAQHRTPLFGPHQTRVLSLFQVNRLIVILQIPLAGMVIAGGGVGGGNVGGAATG